MRTLSRKVCAVLAVLSIAATTETHAWGQAPGESMHRVGGEASSFEVATVKPSRSGSLGTSFGIAPERFSAENATADELIRFAYDVKASGGIEGEPGWAGSERFDVAAKIADAQAEAMQKIQPSQRLEEYRLMMQSLLAERFALTTSTQIKELPVYALVLAKNGPKLALVDPGEQHMPMLSGGSRGELHASSVSMARFADWLSGSADTSGRSVVDETGLKGNYNFTLKWTRIESRANAMAGESQPATSTTTIDEAEPSLFTALQEQLGLKLEPAKGPVKVIEIEHLERPSPN